MSQKYKLAIVNGALSSRGGGLSRSIAKQASILHDAGHSVTLYVGHSKKYPLTIAEFPCKNCSVISRNFGVEVL